MTRSLQHPYTGLTGGQWLRGNLHTHTTHSDGSRPTQAVLDDYAARGYGFLMISDHDVYTSAKDLARFNANGMVLIPGNEISRHGPHMLHVNANRFVAASPLRQQAINQAATGKSFVIVNHPNWTQRFNHCPIEKMEEWIGYVGMEIYNGVICRLQGSPYATDKWDILLAQGRRLWGFANDDSHAATGDVELGWNTAYVKRRTRSAVVEALAAGRFYPSTGVVISAIRVKGTHIRIETENARRITALEDLGKRFAVVDDGVIEVDVPDSATYVRFECWGDGEQFAWTQPFFVVERKQR